MLKKITDPAARLSLLGNNLENIKGTVFRQTQFAEFELRTHEMREKGQALTGEALDKLYAEITKKYYGQDQGVCVVDDYVAHEWAFIPHFYRNFYVFQYATSFTASSALSEKVLGGDAAATKRFLAFPRFGRIEVPDRTAQGCRDRHDDRRTAGPDVKKMNRDHGRDGETARIGGIGSPLTLSGTRPRGGQGPMGVPPAHRLHCLFLTYMMRARVLAAAAMLVVSLVGG